MSSLRLLAVGVAWALSVSSAAAQIVPTGPFVGQHSDGFETQAHSGFTTCIQGRVFSSTADLCDPTGNSMSIAGGWSFMCSIGPYAGGKFAGSAGGPAEYTFDTPATRFGGFFGTNTGTIDGVIEFYDAGNVLISSHPVTAPANCQWAWNGWQVTGGATIKRAKVIQSNPFGGGFMMMDDMEVDYGTPCGGLVTYCTPKVNSLGCVPVISGTGTPSATATSGFTVQSVNMRNNKVGILLYGSTGQAAAAFSGGLLCLTGPLRRVQGLNTGGTPPPANDCTGVFAVDMNSFRAGLLGGNPAVFLSVPGTVVDCQFWGLDPGFPAPNNTQLSDGLEFNICP